jgi:exonuclease III
MPSRWIHLHGVVKGLHVNLLNIYAPNNGAERIRFNKIVCQYVSSVKNDDPFIVGGDYNCDLIDIWRLKNPDKVT